MQSERCCPAIVANPEVLHGGVEQINSSGPRESPVPRSVTTPAAVRCLLQITRKKMQTNIAMAMEKLSALPQA